MIRLLLALAFLGLPSLSGEHDASPATVDFEYLRATANQYRVRLEWRTRSEVDNYGFYVYRSIGTPNDFNRIANSLTAGHGTTPDPHTYVYLDVVSQSGTMWYRLKSIDLDGIEHEIPETVEINVPPIREVLPIPTKFGFYVNCLGGCSLILELPIEQQVSIKMFDILGREISTALNSFLPAGTYSVLLAQNLPTGTYFYRMVSNRFEATLKIIYAR
jgi:hypothetical protein